MLYEMGDVIGKLISQAITCSYYWSEWYVGLIDFGKAIEEWSTCKIWWGKMVSGLVIYSVGDVIVIEGGQDIVSDGLSWVAVEFLIGGGVG